MFEDSARLRQDDPIAGPDVFVHICRMNGADYVREALAIAEAHVTDETTAHRTTPSGQFRASDLAARIGYSVQHFARLFRSLTGESPADYIQKRRLTEAARRILVEPEPIGAIARNAGWADYESVARAKRDRSTPSVL